MSTLITKPLDSKFNIRVELNAKLAELRALTEDMVADIEIANALTGEAIPDDEPLFLLRARDLLAIQVLSYYRGEAIRMGCTIEHLAGLEGVMETFAQFRHEHPERIKQPGSSFRKPAPPKPAGGN